MLTVTSCGKQVSDQSIAATEQSSEEIRAAEAVMGTETVETFSTEKAGRVVIPDGDNCGCRRGKRISDRAE